jgi:hypothetical protein
MRTCMCSSGFCRRSFNGIIRIRDHDDWLRRLRTASHCIDRFHHRHAFQTTLVQKQPHGMCCKPTKCLGNVSNLLSCGVPLIPAVEATSYWICGEIVFPVHRERGIELCV